MKRVVVGVSGSTGSIYGIRLLEHLRAIPDVEVHLVVSAAAKRTLVEETDYKLRDVEALAHVVYDDRDIGAALASGSFHTTAMVVAPCSVKTVAALAISYSDTLIARAGDVTLKEGRRLVALAEIGAIILPPVPAFYFRPKTVDEIVNHTVARILDRLDLPHHLIPEWQGTGHQER